MAKDWDYLAKHWDGDARQAAKKEWPKLTEGDLDEIAGNRAALYAKVGYRYELSPDEAKVVVDQWYGVRGSAKPEAEKWEAPKAPAATKKPEPAPQRSVPRYR